MRFIEQLASYVPSLIVEHLDDQVSRQKELSIPFRQRFQTVCLFCDVSGFTALSERMRDSGAGAEGLARHLNAYFSQMVRYIAADGGDVFKFAGDAVIVLWPEQPDAAGETNENPTALLVRRAVQCAYTLQKNLHNAELAEGVKLSVKIGVGVGDISLLHIGGVHGRMEYVAVGDPLVQAFDAEHLCVAGDVVCSPEAFRWLDTSFRVLETLHNGFMKFDLEAGHKQLRKVSKTRAMHGRELTEDIKLEKLIKGYVAGSLLPNLNADTPEDVQWGNEVRRCCVVFVNLGLGQQRLVAAAEYDEAMQQVHYILQCVQQSVYHYEGSINKFLMDDKGATLIACFGLPPNSHEDDAVRAILSSLHICARLFDLGLAAAAGITTGDVFCGVVGSGTRREYTVLGDSVNLAARLMQQANLEGGGVLCDWDTKVACGGALCFIALDDFRVKGKRHPIKAFRPYHRQYVIRPVGKYEPNIFEEIHHQQLKCYSVHKTLTSLQPYFHRRVHGQGRRHGSLVLPSSVDNTPILKKNNRKSTRFSSMVFFGNQQQPVVRFTPSNQPRSEAPTFTPKTRHLIARNDLRKPEMAVPRGSRPSTGRADDTILITVPEELRLDNFSEDFSPQLPSITFAEVPNFEILLFKALQLAKETRLVPDDLADAVVGDFTLSIEGTRSFLPEIPFDIKWLPAFIAEAQRGTGRDDVKVERPLRLLLIRQQDKLNIQWRNAVARRKLLEKKISLLENRQGSVVLIEGEAGMGKSDLISSFAAKTLPHTCPMYLTSGSPYNQFESFGPWAIVIQQYLDARAVELGGGKSRRDSLLEELAGQKELLEDAYLVEDLLGIKAKRPTPKNEEDGDSAQYLSDGDGREGSEHPPDALDLEPEEARARRLRLLFFLVKRMSTQKPSIVVMDDAQFLDDDSWTLALVVAHGSLTVEKEDGQRYIEGDDEPLPLMLVLAMRPLTSYMSVFREIPLHYHSLSATENFCFLKLDGLAPEEVEELVAQKLGPNVSRISEQLMKLVETKCQGNPSAVVELMNALQTAQPPALVYYEDRPGLDEDFTAVRPLAPPGNPPTRICEVQVALVEGFNFDDCPLPRRVARTLGTVIDRLNSCQQMILKTAAMIGQRFKWSFMLSCYPIDGHKSRLRRELEELEELGILNVIQRHAVVRGSHGQSERDETYEITYPFLVDALRSRMLRSQKEMVSEQVKKQQHALDKVRRRLYMQKALGAGKDELKNGMLDVRKAATTSFLKRNVKRKIQGGDWKRRFCVLRGSKLEMYRETMDERTERGVIEPTQTIYLKGAKAERPNIMASDEPVVFRVDANGWRKEGVDHFEMRTFHFRAENLDEAQDWVYMIKYAIETQREEDPNNRSELQSEADDTSLTSGSEDVKETADAHLFVLVQQARNLINAEVYGTSNPYVSLKLDDHHKKTSTVISVSLNPTWDETHVFPLRRDQLHNASLQVQVWNRDLFLTDDFLGQHTIDLGEIVPEHWHPSTVVSSDEVIWWTLQSRRVSEAVMGEIALGTRVVLSPSLTEDALQLGSMENFREKISAEARNKPRAKHENGEGVSIQLGKRRSRAGSAGRIEIPAAIRIATGFFPSTPGSKFDFSERRRSQPVLRIPSRGSVAISNPDVAALLNSVDPSAINQLLFDLISSLRENAPKPNSSADVVSKEWVLQRLRGILERSSSSIERRRSGAESRVLNTSSHKILAQTDDLGDDTQKQWLRSQYMRNSLDENQDNSVLDDLPNAAAHDGIIGIIKTNTSLLLQNPEDATLYYKDTHGRYQGPFTPQVILAWYMAGYLHEQVPVRVGHDEFLPLAAIVGALQHVVDFALKAWPETLIGESFLDVPDDPSRQYHSWKFNIWQLEQHQLVQLAMAAVSHLQLPSIFNIPMENFQRFMSTVEQYMTKNNNAYHNYYHVTDVMQTCFVFASTMGAAQFLTDLELLALLIGALVHDLDHNGTNNAYHINAQTELALRYNDQSPMENHHCAVAFQTLRDPAVDVFVGLEPPQLKLVRKLMISAIIATDMTFHFSLKDELDACIVRNRPTENEPAPKLHNNRSSISTASVNSMPVVLATDKDREILLKTLLHIADISNPAKVWTVCKKWSDLVITEFFEQGDREKNENLPVSPNMDRDTTHQSELSINFIDFIVAPFFIGLSGLLPRVRQCCEQLSSNRAKWDSMNTKRLQETEVDDNRLDETLARWQRRKMAFENVMNPVLDESVDGE